MSALEREQVKRNLRAFPVWQRLDLVGGAAMLYFGAPHSYLPLMCIALLAKALA